MKLARFYVFLGVLAAGLAQGSAIPLQDFFRLPEKSNFTLSPDGRNIAYLAPWNARLNISLRVPDKADRRVTHVKDRDLSFYLWKGNSRLVYAKDNNGDENFHLYRVDLKSGKTKNLTPFPGVRAQIIDDLLERDDELLVALNKRNRQVFDAYRLNLTSGKLTLVEKNPGNVTRWITDHTGVIRAALVLEGVRQTVLYRDKLGLPLRPLLTTTFRDTFTPLLFTFDNQRFYAASNVGRDKIALVEFDPKSGKETKEIYARSDVDVASLDYSLKRRAVTCARYETDKPGRYCFDVKSARLFAKWQALFPGYQVEAVSRNRDEDKFILTVANDKSYGKSYVYDQKSDKLELLADSMPWLQEEKMASMKPIRFQSRDGLVIHGYLTLPPGKEKASALPVILHPHGGPWVRDSWRFNREVQFFANRGWAVLQVNYRGSTGYGRKFWEASFKQWGGTMQDDLTDAVKWLQQQDIADPEKVCIYGASYGGYATLAGITKTPTLYRCAVDYVGVSNLLTFMNTIPPYWAPMREKMYAMVGDPQKDYDMLRERSPVFHADRIQTPLLVLQGAKDPRVNINESNQIVDALRKRGVEVEYILKINEGHGFRNEENRMDAYRVMEKFFRRYLD